MTYIPAFGVFDGVAEHIIENGLSEVVQFLQLRILLVNDTRQQIQLRNNTRLLLKRRNGNWHRKQIVFREISSSLSCPPKFRLIIPHRIGTVEVLHQKMSFHFRIINIPYIISRTHYTQVCDILSIYQTFINRKSNHKLSISNNFIIFSRNRSYNFLKTTRLKNNTIMHRN